VVENNPTGASSALPRNRSELTAASAGQRTRSKQMFRLFVAIDLPAPLKEQLIRFGGGIPGAHWLEASQLHLTLKFIGPVDGGKFRDVVDVLRDVESDSFNLALKGMGHFPPRKKPEQLWVGVKQSDQLLILHNRIDSALTRVGLPREARKFAPHVTLANMKGTKENRVAAFIAEYNLFESEPFPVNEFCLFSSVLASEGAIHEIEAIYPLKLHGEKPE
jgi:RNA 2',3'-cyclic 3'-phosphodiesterase